MEPGWRLLLQRDSRKGYTWLEANGEFEHDPNVTDKNFETLPDLTAEHLLL